VTVHPAGWADPSSASFHGKDLERRGWSFAVCQSCHGTDYKGSENAPSCFTCHTNGPTACDTCHANPPTTGAHTAHLARGQQCSDCHVVPATWDAPGHILDENRQPIPPPARVTLGALANRDVTPPRRTGPASYAAGRCTSVYCHGGVLGDPAASDNQPLWTGGPAEAACGTCHGRPPASHAQSECTMCHPTTVAADGSLSSHHIDGVIDVGDGSGPCTGCHGNAQSPAPPRGLHGEQLTTDLAVGAHRVHLVGGVLRGPIACSECHLVPTAVGDPGHIDSALPAALVFGPLATADGATPTWDRTTATCSRVYCHGGGNGLSAEPSPNRVPVPVWTSTTAQTAYCGACHGLPPSDSSHAPTLQLTDCATCHASTVGPFGNILVTNGTHINGVVDLGAANAH
jgi:predicted CxxxxCH...CXXCH cytochrome family protein